MQLVVLYPENCGIAASTVDVAPGLEKVEDGVSDAAGW